MPSPAHIDERIHNLLLSKNRTAVECVFAYLTVGLTCCRIVRTRRDNLNEKCSAGIEQARTLLQIAEKFMWRVKQTHPEFDQMVARVERLKFEIAALDR
jgi:hypothetical protein